MLFSFDLKNRIAKETTTILRMNNSKYCTNLINNSFIEYKIRSGKEGKLEIYFRMVNMELDLPAFYLFVLKNLYEGVFNSGQFKSIIKKLV